jgi:hypothetical protein
MRLTTLGELRADFLTAGKERHVADDDEEEHFDVN